MDNLKVSPFYYGKVTSHGDFLKSKGQAELIKLFDEWLSESLKLAMDSPKFQERYMTCPPFDFFIGNPKEPMFVIANLVASQDHSERRFPMLIGYVLEIDKPEPNLSYSPFRYKTNLVHLLVKNKALFHVTKTEELFEKLNQLQTEIEVLSLSKSMTVFDNYTMYSFAKLMNISLYELIQSMIGLGLLLQPIAEQGVQQLNKTLTIPLNERFRNEIATFWVNLICGFLSKYHIEVLIGIVHSNKPRLVFSFQGAEILALKDIFIQDFDNDHWVSLENAQWVDEYLHENASLACLEQMLCERQLSVNQGIRLFHQYFIDESL